MNNKIRFEKEFNERREKERKKLEEKEKQLLAVRLKAQEKQLEREEAEREELLELKKEAQDREKNLMQRKEDELIKKYEELQKRRDEEEYERQMKMEDDLLNYYNSKEREDYKRKLEFMKNQARISRKNKNNNNSNPSNQKDNNNEEPQNQSQVRNVKNPPNVEQTQQKEKKSSESMSFAEKSSIKSKSKKRKSKIKQKDKKTMSSIKEQSQKNSKILSKKKEIHQQEKVPEPDDDLKSEEIVAITNNETPPMLSLKQFIQLYTPGEDSFIKYVKHACKNSISSILKCESFTNVLRNKKRNELSSEGYTGSLSESKQERLNKSLNFTISQINQKIESLFNDLSNYISEDNISNEMQDFYKFITGKNNFVPYTFFSLFELSRLSSSGGYIKNVNDNQKKMIIGIYVIIKILLNYCMLEYNFLKEENKNKLEEDSKINLKLISSIIYYQIIGMNKSICKVVQPIPDIPKKINEQLSVSNDVKILIEKVESNFLKGDPDTNENTIEYIELKLYPASEFKKYTDGIKENDFSLNKVIYDFINKFFNFMENV